MYISCDIKKEKIVEKKVKLVQPKFLVIDGKSIPNQEQMAIETLAMVFDEDWRKRFEDHNYTVLPGIIDRDVTIWVSEDTSSVGASEN